MENVLIYVIQVNILIAISYLGYQLLLKNLTFYKLNRIYLLSVVLFSLMYPFLNLKSLFERHFTVVGEGVVLFPADLIFDKAPPSFFTVATVVAIILCVGGSAFVIKLLIQLASLMRIHLHSRPAKWQRYLFRNVLFPIAPFSFMKKIYLNIEQHQDIELSDIFKHEEIHVKGLHTIDILLFELVLISCWYNPLVWLMRKAVRENLEFLTDQQVLSRGVDRKTYQYSLLHVNKQGMALGISNQFNFKTLKKRMMMMNKKRSSKIELSKYAFLLPVFIFVAAAFTVDRADAKIVEAVKAAQETDLKAISSDLNQLFEKEDTIISTSKIVTIKGKDVEKVDTLRFKDASLKRRESYENLPPEKRPLIIVDGVESATELQGLDPNTIKEISIFKDEGATSLYGDKGKNGVILVTTKVKGTTTITSQLQGKVSGVTIGSVADTTVNLRFGDSKKTPLYIVDGIVSHAQEPLKNLNPEDIESIEILKNDNATTVYGEKGKDGVILITTKKGNRGEKLESQIIDNVTIVGYSKDAPSSNVNVYPEPKNGMTNFRKWIGDNFVYPQSALDAGAKGVIQIAFVVEKDGSLSNIRTIQDIGHGTGVAAINLLKKSPKWIPGSREGKPIRFEYILPIILNLGKLK